MWKGGSLNIRPSNVSGNPEPRPLAERDINANTVGVTLNGTSQKILPRNKNRTYLLIQNRSASTIFLSFGTGIDDQNFNCLEIVAGGNYEPNTNQLKMIISDVFIKASVVNSNIAITEGVLV